MIAKRLPQAQIIHFKVSYLLAYYYSTIQFPYNCRPCTRKHFLLSMSWERNLSSWGRSETEQKWNLWSTWLWGGNNHGLNIVTLWLSHIWSGLGKIWDQWLASTKTTESMAEQNFPGEVIAYRKLFMCRAEYIDPHLDDGSIHRKFIQESPLFRHKLGRCRCSAWSFSITIMFPPLQYDECIFWRTHTGWKKWTWIPNSSWCVGETKDYFPQISVFLFWVSNSWCLAFWQDLGAIANPMFKMKGPTMIQKNYSPAFPLKHQQKDMRLALALGDENSVSMPVAAASNEVSPFIPL